MSHIPIDFGQHVGVFHIVTMRCPHQRYLRGGKRYPLLLFYQENFPCSKTCMRNLCWHLYHDK